MMKHEWKRVVAWAGFMGALSVFAGAVAFAGTSGQLTLSGTVPAATAIVVAANSTASALDLSQSATNLKVATVQEINNTANGYTISASSLNGGKLKNGSISTLLYTATLGGASVPLNISAGVFKTISPSNNVVNVTNDLAVSYTGAAPKDMMAGTYTDTITFTITAQ